MTIPVRLTLIGNAFVDWDPILKFQIKQKDSDPIEISVPEQLQREHFFISLRRIMLKNAEIELSYTRFWEPEVHPIPLSGSIPEDGSIWGIIVRNEGTVSAQYCNHETWMQAIQDYWMPKLQDLQLTTRLEGESALAHVERDKTALVGHAYFKLFKSIGLQIFRKEDTSSTTAIKRLNLLTKAELLRIMGTKRSTQL